MKRTIDGVEYEHGATHAGLDCWLPVHLVKYDEVRIGAKPSGDFAKDELIRYLAGPDDYRNAYSIIITDERGKPWPLRNTHRNRGVAQGIEHRRSVGETKSPEKAERAGSTPAAPDYHTKKTEKIVRGEDAFEPIGTMPVVGDVLRCTAVSDTDFHVAELLDSWSPGEITCADGLGSYLRDENRLAKKWRILKRERGTELLGARE